MRRFMPAMLTITLAIAGLTGPAVPPVAATNAATTPTDNVVLVRPDHTFRAQRSTNRTAERAVARPRVLDSIGTSPAAGWVANGIRGAVNIGVIDFFEAATLTTQTRAGRIPAIPLAHRFCRDRGAACTFGPRGSTRRGNEVVEVIADQAPAANFFLAEVSTAADFRAAIDWFVVSGVKIVNQSSIGAYDGPGNGTGVAASIIDYAVSKGLTWFQAAGDAGLDPEYTYYRGGYWRGTWNDPDGDGWLNFNGVDETLGTLCGALLGLRWSDWGAARTDYELWIGDMTLATQRDGTAALASDRNQATGHAMPLEGNDFRWLCNTNPADGPVYDKNHDHLLYLKVKRSKRSTAASSVGDRLELQVHNGWFEYSVAGGAAAVGFADTKNPGAATIGHIGSYSSMGPTNDRRIKPDLTSDGCWPTSVYGPCDGTNKFPSAETATAIATGTAAVVLDGLGPLRPAQLVQFMRNNGSTDSALDAAEPVELPSNSWGYGEVRLRGSGPNISPYRATRYMPSMRHVIDTRVANNVRAGTAPIARNASLTLHVENVYGSQNDESRLMAINLTTTGTLGAGTVQVGPAGWMVPGTSTAMTIRGAGETQSAFMIVPLGPSGEIVVSTTAGGHFIVDQLGYFSNEGAPGNIGFHPVPPYRVYNTRTLGAPLASKVKRDIKITGPASANAALTLPASGVAAVALSITADAPSAAGWATVVPTTPAATPTIAELRFGTAKTTTNTVIVPVDRAGKIRLYSTVGTHFQVDVLGYFAAFIGGDFHFHEPARVADSRRASATPPAAGAFTDVDASALVPADAAAVFGMLSTGGATAKGALRVAATVAAAGTSSSFRSISVSAVAQSISVGTFSALNAGHATITASNVAHRAFDVLGWFDPVAFGDPASIATVPADPTAPNALRGRRLKLSPNGRKALFDVYDAGVPGLTALDRDTNTFTHLDLTAGTGTPDDEVWPLAISDDGTRVVFKTLATNIAPGAADVSYDWFLLNTTSGALQRLNQTDLGAQIPESSVVGANTAASQFVTWTAGRAQVRDLITGSVTVDAVRPSGTYNPELTAAVATIGMWSAIDGAMHPLPSDASAFRTMASPDGRYLYWERRNSGVTLEAHLFDATTDTDTLLCTTIADAFIIATAGVDWSAGPPVVGEWCHVRDSAQFRVVSANGIDLGPRTTDGRAPMNSINQMPIFGILHVGNGEVVFLTDAVNIGPSKAGGMLIYDNPDL